MSASLKEGALQWAARGYAIVPLRPKSAAPHGFLVPHGYKDASREPSLIADWWDYEPNANIAAATGGNLFVLDIDGDEGCKSMKALAVEHGELPKTLAVKTRRGWHFHFKTDTPVKSSVAYVGPGLDIKCEHGMATLPPSIHPKDGSAYQLARDLPLADCPEWLIKRSIKPEPPPRAPQPFPMPRSHEALMRSIKGVIGLVGSSTNGERNAILFWGACTLAEKARDGDIPESLALDLLCSAAAAAGLPRIEATKTIQSGFRKVCRHG